MKADRRDSLDLRMAQLGIRDADLVESFIRGTGPGGQKINKTASCVQLRHLPSGIEIKCQRERSRELNRLLAREELCERLEDRRRKAELERKKVAARRRYQKRKPSRGQTERRLRNKKHRSECKRHRRGPGPSD